MYKYLSGILLTVSIVLGGFLWWNSYKNTQEQTDLNNRIAELQGIVQETETAVSVKAQEVKNLQTSNDELQSLLDRKDEDILVLSKAVLTWKDRYFEIKDATSTIEDPNGNPINLPQECEEALKDKRFKVVFSQQQDELEISGFTLTNPPEAQINLRWTEPLVLDIILSKDSRGFYHLYLDPNSTNTVPAELSLALDPSVLVKWYEKISFQTNIFAGEGVFASAGMGYNISDNLSTSISIGSFFDGSKLHTIYGVSAGWYPWKR